MWPVVGSICFAVMLFFVISAIVSKVKKTGKAKRQLMYAGALFVLFIVSIAASPSSDKKPLENAAQASDKTPAASSTAVDEAKNKAAAAEKAKAEADALAKANAEEEAKKKAPIPLSGKGDRATAAFTLDAGLAVFDTSHTGSSNFALKLVNSDGKQLDLLVNTIGQYKGKTLAVIPSQGDYLLNVTADGSWNVNINQAIPSDMPSAPTVLKGTGDQVVFVNLEKKLTRFAFTHTGEQNFVVKINGKTLLVNEIGKYEGSQAKSVNDAGPYPISVEADGDWSIDIQ